MYVCILKQIFEEANLRLELNTRELTKTFTTHKKHISCCNTDLPSDKKRQYVL